MAKSISNSSSTRHLAQSSKRSCSRRDCPTEAGGNIVFIGLDLGQSAVKATALTLPSARTWSASVGYRTEHPEPGWSEQDPSEWLRAAGSASRQLLSQVTADGVSERIEGICFTGATHHGVLVDDSGEPVRRVITMRDLRSTAEASWLNEHLGEHLLQVTRNVAGPAWTLAHLRWLRQHDRTVLQRARRMVFGKDFLIGRWAGVWATDRSEAEGSLLFDPQRRGWDQRLVDASGLVTAQLPDVVDCGTLIGHLNHAGSAATGLPMGLPVISGCSDTAAEAFSAGISGPGDCLVKLATSGNVTVFLDHPDPRPEWVSYTSLDPQLFYQAFGTSTAASAYQWWRAVIAPAGQLDYSTLDREAAAVSPGSRGVFFLPYLAGRRAPQQDATRRAAFVGLDQLHGRGELTRAVFEGVAHMFRDCVDVARGWGHDYDDLRIIGGGAQSTVWVQIMADVLNAPLTLPIYRDASIGGAMLAAMAVTGAPDIDSRHQVGTTIEPDARAADQYREQHEQFVDISAALAVVDRARSAGPGSR